MGGSGGNGLGGRELVDQVVEVVEAGGAVWGSSVIAVTRKSSRTGGSLFLLVLDCRCHAVDR